MDRLTALEALFYQPEDMPARCPPCTGRGIMVKGGGYRPENAAWEAWLTEPDSAGGVRGVDPMSLPLALLTAAGHPRVKSNRELVYRYRVALGQASGEARHDPLPHGCGESVTGWRDICQRCAGDGSGRRGCPVYDCPIWPYRTGRNPHDPRRGRLPEVLQKYRFQTKSGTNAEQNGNITEIDGSPALPSQN